MKRSLTLTFLTLVVLAIAACSSGGPQQLPQDQVKLDQYPIIAQKHAMTDAEIEKLGLRRVKLDQPLAAFNHYRQLGRGAWKYETLPVGTEVAVDLDGRTWYKTDCANRLFVPSCPVCTPGWWPFGWPGTGSGGLPPWWLWLLVPLLGGLLWWLLRRKPEHYEFPVRKLKPSAPARVDVVSPVVVPVVTPLVDKKGDVVKNLVAKVSKIESDLVGVKTELTKLGETPKPADLPAVPPAPASVSPVAPAAMPDPAAATPIPVAAAIPAVPKLTLAEAQDLCLRHIKLERAGIRALYKRWDSSKISDDEFVAGVEAILAD